MEREFVKIHSVTLDSNGKTCIVKPVFIKIDTILSISEYVRPKVAKFTKDYPAKSVIRSNNVHYFCLETLDEIMTSLVAHSNIEAYEILTGDNYISLKETLESEIFDESDEIEMTGETVCEAEDTLTEFPVL